jgi:hypothetical protein
MAYPISGGRALKWIAIAAIASIAAHQFFVQEMIAAFLLFAVVFACVAVVVLVFVAQDEAWRVSFARAPMYIGPCLLKARWSHRAVINSSAANISTPLLDRGTTVRR